MAGSDVKISELGEASVLLDTDILLEVTEVNNTLVSIGVPASEIKEYAIGDTSISGIGDGTPTGAISALNVSKAAKSDIAPQEATTASKTYNPGDEFYLGGVLYRAKTTISSGTAWASLTLDTDYEVAPDMTSQIQTLANSLSTEITNRENADEGINDRQKKLGAWNRLENTKAVGATVTNAYTFTVNSNKTVTGSGTPTGGNADLVINNSITLNQGEKYWFSCKGIDSLEDGKLEMYYKSDASVFNDKVTKDGKWITIPQTGEYMVYLRVNQGRTVNATFEPVLALEEDSDYVPYAKTNRELTENLGIEFYNLESYAGTNVTTIRATAIKFNDCVFLTCYWIGNNNSNEPILTVPSELRPKGNTTVQIPSGTVSFGSDSNAKTYPSNYTIRNAGTVHEQYTSNKVQSGSFTAIYSISKSVN